MGRPNYRIGDHAAAGSAAAAKSRMTLTNVTRELGPLQEAEDAQRWLQHIALWCAADKMRPGLAGACVRAVESWIKANDLRHERDRVRDLERRVRDLSHQLDAALKAQGKRI